MQFQLEEFVTGCKSPTVGKLVPKNCLSEEKRELQAIHSGSIL